MSFDPKNFKKPSVVELEKKLSSVQFSVTQHEETEKPFENEYHDEKAHGIYVDIVSGEPLFSSLDKFDSGCGWPSFSRPMSGTEIITKVDHRSWMERVEVRSKYADSHLGHVFEDGPLPTGLRYCINSASIRFIPLSNLKAEGYADYLKLFQNSDGDE